MKKILLVLCVMAVVFAGCNVGLQVTSNSVTFSMGMRW